jgi:tryptophan halogenase
MRPNPWIGNCVAIGDAAASLEPLDAAQLQVLQIGLTHLLAMFPIDAAQMPEAGAYNRVVTAHFENVRDFQIAHYKLNKRLDAPFWDRCRDTDPPASLAYKLALFERCAQVALYDHETFQEENWIANFLGHGLIPKSYDARADALEGAALMAQFQQMLHFIASEVTDMPSLEAHMETHAPSPSTGLF